MPIAPAAYCTGIMLTNIIIYTMELARYLELFVPLHIDPLTRTIHTIVGQIFVTPSPVAKQYKTTA